MTDDRRAPHVKPWRFTATNAELWNACPYAFSQKLELGIEEVAGQPLRIGRLMAMTVERYISHCAALNVPTDVDAIGDIARQVYAEEGVGLGLDALDEVLRIGSFYVQQHTLDLEHLVGVEVWLPPHGMEPLTFAGLEVVGKTDELYMDHEGSIATVVDAKTNWSVWSQREAREALQARLYPVLVAHSFPDVDEIRMIYDFIRHGVVREVRWTRGEVEVEREKLEALAEQMQKPGKRPATPGDHCAICGYISRCPVFKSARQSGVFILPTNEEEARNVTETLLVLDAAAKQRRSALRTYTKEHGPIAFKGVRIGHFETKTPIADPYKFTEWANDQDIDPLEWMSIGPREIAKLQRRRKSLADLIDYETTTRFDVKRSDEEVEEAVP